MQNLHECDRRSSEASSKDSHFDILVLPSTTISSILPIQPFQLFFDRWVTARSERSTPVLK